MSLRDELQSWLDEVTFRSVWPIIERTLTAERVATMAEVEREIMQGRAVNNFALFPEVLRALEWLLSDIRRLPRDRSALDEMLAQARAEGEHMMFDQFWDVAGIHYGCRAGKHSPESLLLDIAKAVRAEVACPACGGELGACCIHNK